MAKFLYHDGFPYKLKFPRDEDKGKHYFPVYGRDGRILYWVRRDLLESIPWLYFSVPGFVEEDLVLEYDDFLEVPGYDTLTFDEVLSAADETRAARFQADRARLQQAHEMLDILQAEGVPIGGRGSGGGNNNGWWSLGAFIIVLLVGFYWSATVFVFPKVIIRSVTKNTNISLPWGNVCRMPSGTSNEDIVRDASLLFGSSVDLQPEYGSIQQVKSGRCLDGVTLTGATINAVTGSSAVLVNMTGPEDMPKLLPGVKQGEGGCIFPLPAHPGKGVCQNVGSIQGDVELISDLAYWLFVYEPDLKPSNDSGGGGPPTQPTAAVQQ